MDTWLIAQCMARLPPLTYFSHPESSLDNFFSGEATAVMDGVHRGDYLSSIQQGAAPHELQFLRSLSQSLGIDPMANGRAVELNFRRYHGRILSCDHFPNPVDRYPSATADERTTGQPLRSLSDHRSFTDPSEIPTSSSGPISVSILPFLSTAANTQAPAMSSSAQHVVSCKDQNRSKSAQLRVVTNVPHTSSRYQCIWEVAGKRPCGEWIEGGSKEIWIHVRTAHGLKGLYSSWCHCKWGGCLEKLKVSSLQRHLGKHLDIKWRCLGCDRVFARCDYMRKHMKWSKECHGAEAATRLALEKISGTSIKQVATGIAENSLTDSLAMTW